MGALKVDNPNSVTFLIKGPIFELYVAPRTNNKKACI